MKAPFKLFDKHPYLARIAGLALTVVVSNLLLVGAQAAPTAAPDAAATPASPAPSGAASDSSSAAKSAGASAPDSTATASSTPPAVIIPATPPPTIAAFLIGTDADLTVPEYTNWVTLGGGNAWVSGNKGQYKHEQNTNSGPFGGVQDFHWQTFVGKTGTFTLDGHGIFGNHDYDLKLNLTDEKLGYIRAGFTEFRTWYNPDGGFYPLNGLSFQPSESDLFVDRRKAWVEAGLTLPDLPIFVLRYEYDSRKGMMDSTSWGQTTLIPGGGQTKIAPTFLGIDETRHIFSGSIKDTFGDTDAALGLRYEIDRTDDNTYIDQNPTQTSNALITQRDIERNNIFNAEGSTMTLFDKKITLTSGFSVTTVDTNLGGSRIYGTSYNAPLAPGFINNGSGFTNLGSGTGGTTKDYVGNLNLMLTPIDNLVVVPSARIEYQDSNLSDGFNNTSGNGAGFTSVGESANTNNWELDMTQALEARYTGFRDWSLYANTEVSENWGNNSWNSAPVLNQVNFNQDWGMIGLKPTLGANWYPLPQLNFGLQYYHEIHDYDYTNKLNSGLVQYPGYLRKQNFTTDDMNIRATWQALSTVSLVTRYDFQLAGVDTWAIPNGGTQAGGVESATYINHIISEDVNWAPLSWLYLQVGGSYVLNTLETPVAGSSGINNLGLNGENNYWTLDASVGYEINSKTHLQLQYSYYNADNYVNNAPTSLPYGAGDIENSFTATLTREINKNVQVSVKYGFYQNRDETSGGQYNYDAQLVYVSTTFGF